jgi:hypothetical protein
MRTRLNYVWPRFWNLMNFVLANQHRWSEEYMYFFGRWPLFPSG